MLTSCEFSMPHELEDFFDNRGSKALKEAESAKKLDLLFKFLLFFLSNNPDEVFLCKSCEATIILAYNSCCTALIVFKKGQLTK